MRNSHLNYSLNGKIGQNRANWMRNQVQWIRRQLKDPRTVIIDIGPRGKAPLSKYDKMNKQEKDYLEEHILKLVADNKKGISTEVIIDYLDYVNKVNYTQDEIKPILVGLIEEKKMLKKGSLFFPM